MLATGSELVPVDQKPGQDQIRDSNNYSISAYAQQAGAIVERCLSTGDDTELLKTAIAEAAETLRPDRHFGRRFDGCLRCHESWH